MSGNNNDNNNTLLLLLNSKDIQIKYLIELLQENKITIPSSFNTSSSSDKTFDDIMKDTCSIYNKHTKNTKMVYIDNVDCDFEIDYDDDDDDIIAPPSSPQKNITTTSTIATHKTEFETIFTNLKTIRTPKKLLSEYVKLKMSTLSLIDVKTYTEILLEHHLIIGEICTSKNYTKKRTEEIMSLCYSPLDLRLLCYQMNRSKYPKNLPINVGQTFINSDDIDYLKKSLLTSTYKGNHKEKMISNFLNYGIAVVTLKQNIDVYLSSQNVKKYVVYLKEEDDTTDEGDPYRFYYLNKETKKKKHWEMDCRLDGFISIFIKNVTNYLVRLFRTIYHDVFHDNLYRENYAKSAIIFENDCDQLLRNLCVLVNYKATSALIRQTIKTNCSYIEDPSVDVFALRSDDKLLKKELEKRETEIDYDVLEMLFDDIPKDKVDGLYLFYK